MRAQIVKVTKRGIDTVLDRVGCAKHNRPKGIPCFHIPCPDNFGYYGGICGTRAAQVYNGRIQQKSTGNKRPR